MDTVTAVCDSGGQVWAVEPPSDDLDVQVSTKLA
jgi:hypothetical protein